MDAEYSLYCVNCGSAGGSLVLENEDILRCIQQWTVPRMVSGLRKCFSNFDKNVTTYLCFHKHTISRFSNQLPQLQVT